MGMLGSEPGGRQTFVDALRGWALLGIALINVSSFGMHPSEGYLADGVQGELEGIDWWVSLALTALVQGKFYLLFSFLFGYSALFLLKQREPEQRRVFRRRLVALLVVGLAHGVFLFAGDILVLYATLGFVLLYLSRHETRVLWGVVAGSFVLSAALYLLLGAAAWDSADEDEFLLPIEQELIRALVQGSFFEAARARLAYLPLAWFGGLLGTGGPVLAAFCVGLWAARRQWLADVGRAAAPWKGLLALGLLVGLPVQCALAYLTHSEGGTDASGAMTSVAFAWLLLLILTAPLLSAGYLAALALASAQGFRWIAWPSPSGRASLSAYLGQSVVFSTLFSGYGFGLYGEWGLAGSTTLALLTWVLWNLALRRWLARHTRGPVETLLARWVHRSPAAPSGETSAPAQSP